MALDSLEVAIDLVLAFVIALIIHSRTVLPGVQEIVDCPPPLQVACAAFLGGRSLP
jgi:hypothetical protein